MQYTFFAIALLLPLSVRFFLFPKKKRLLTGLFEDFFYAIELFLILSLLPKQIFLTLFCLSQFYILLDAFFYAHTQIRFRLSFFKQLVHPQSFFQSAEKAGLVPFCVSFLILSSYLACSIYFLSFSWEGVHPYFLFLFLPFLLTRTKAQENICIFIQRDTISHWLLRMFSKKTSLSFASQSEISTKVSEEYPLLKWTAGFQGEKLFSLPKQSKKPNLIFLFMESFRAKELSCMGSPHKATSQFDRLVNEGIFFSDFYANGVITAHGALSSYTGILPEQKPKNMISYTSFPLIGLGKMMKDQGYGTHFMHNGYYLMDRQQCFFKNLGCDHLHWRNEICAAFPEASYTSWGVDDEYLIRYALQWMEEKPQHPFFLSLFTISNHHPWLPIENFSVPEFQLPKDSTYHRYLSTLHYVDHWIGYFIDELRKKDLMKNTYIFLLGDHGASMREHHSNETNLEYLYEENIRVPLLILGDKVTPAIIDQPGSQIDLLPTVCDLLDVKGMNHSIGRSLIRKEKKNVYFFNPFGEGYLGLRSKNSKYILNTKTEREELFDLSTDPEEKQNLSSQNQELCKAFKAEVTQLSQYFNHLYQKKKFSPKASQDLVDFRVPPDWRENDIEHWMNKSRIPSYLDFSKNLNIRDSTITSLFNQHSEFISLDFSECTGITDKSLHSLIEHCPNIQALSLAHCHTLSEEGINSLVSNCKKLMNFKLSGLTFLSENTFKGALFSLRFLDLIDAEKITDRCIEHLTPCLSRLEGLLLNCEYITNKALDSIGENGKLISILHLENGYDLSEKALAKLLKKMPQLKMLTLCHFPQVDGSSFSSLPSKSMERVTLKNLPAVSDKHIHLLNHLSLSHLLLFSTPNISSEAVQKLQRPGLSIYRV